MDSYLGSKGITRDVIETLMHNGCVSLDDLQLLDAEMLDSMRIYKPFDRKKLLALKNEIIPPSAKYQEIVTLFVNAKILPELAQKYAFALTKEGFDSPDKIANITDADLAACGITSRFDVRIIAGLKNQMATTHGRRASFAPLSVQVAPNMALDSLPGPVIPAMVAKPSQQPKQALAAVSEEPATAPAPVVEEAPKGNGFLSSADMERLQFEEEMAILEEKKEQEFLAAKQAAEEAEAARAQAESAAKAQEEAARAEAEAAKAQEETARAQAEAEAETARAQEEAARAQAEAEAEAARAQAEAEAEAARAQEEAARAQAEAEAEAARAQEEAARAQAEAEAEAARAQEEAARAQAEAEAEAARVQEEAAKAEAEARAQEEEAARAQAEAEQVAAQAQAESDAAQQAAEQAMAEAAKAQADAEEAARRASSEPRVRFKENLVEEHGVGYTESEMM